MKHVSEQCIKYIFLLIVVVFLGAERAFALVPQQTIVIDHTAIDQFDRRASNGMQSYMNDASALRLMLRHASVGGNINDGLNALGLPRSNWNFQFRDNPPWYDKISDFEYQVGQQWNSRDVFSMKFCFIDQDAGKIADLQGASSYIKHMETLQARFVDDPTKFLVWWTMPILTTNDGNQAARQAFNTAVRNYAKTHPILLYDIAAIESHNLLGSLVSSGGYEAMYEGYSSDGGHLSTGDTGGAIRAAKAWWVLMSRIAGWNPEEGTISPTVTVQPSNTPTAVPVEGDLDGSGRVDYLDFQAAIGRNPFSLFAFRSVVFGYGKP